MFMYPTLKILNTREDIHAVVHFNFVIDTFASDDHLLVMFNT